MLLVNGRTGGVVASSVEVAQTRAARRRGLLRRAGLPPGTAFLISRCSAIHTVGMRFAIDVAFVDSGGRVRKIVRALPPWRVALAPGASSAIEFAAGELQPQVLGVGDRLYLLPRPPHAT